MGLFIDGRLSEVAQKVEVISVNTAVTGDKTKPTGDKSHTKTKVASSIDDQLKVGYFIKFKFIGILFAYT
jgi:hypothetical protein